MSGQHPDPRSISSIAVTSSDVVDAFVYTQTNPGRAVIRVTPPFHGRMRARLHVYHVDDGAATGAIHLDPAHVLERSVVAAYPNFEAPMPAPSTGVSDSAGGETAEDGAGTDGDRSEPSAADGEDGQNTPSLERQRKAHARAVDRWRNRALEGIVPAVRVRVYPKNTERTGAAAESVSRSEPRPDDANGVRHEISIAVLGGRAETTDA